MTIAMGAPYLRAPAVARACAVVFGAALACSSDPAPQPARSGSAVAPAPAASSVAHARDVGDAWARAGAGQDGAELARLAEEVGAQELVAALEDRDRGGVAARALPYAPDRDLAVGPLAACVQRGGAAAEACAAAVVHVLSLPGRDRERLDPEGEARAARDLLVVAGDPRRPRALRASAVTALRHLSERGVVNASAIPTALDP